MMAQPDQKANDAIKKPVQPNARPVDKLQDAEADRPTSVTASANGDNLRRDSAAANASPPKSPSPRVDPTSAYVQERLNACSVQASSSRGRPLTPRDFHFRRILGEGSFSTVILATKHSTGDKYAIKVLVKDDIRRDKKVLYVQRERDILALLTHVHGGHPFVLKLYSTFQDQNRLYFALGYAQHGELLEWLRRLGSFDETVSRFYAAEILAALEFLHGCRIVHRDLKPENILVGADWHILISDFGTAKLLDNEEEENDGEDKVRDDRNDENDVDSADDDENDSSLSNNNKAQKVGLKERNERSSSFVGTAQYISPEVLNSEPVGPECDYWALGAIIFQMISGQPPFRAINEYQIMKKILNLNYAFPDGFPATARDLIQRLLVQKSARLGAPHNGGIGAIKEHVYFSGVDWANITRQKPPELKPYLPASKGEPAFYGERAVHDDDAGEDENVEPGFNDATMTRLLGVSFAEFARATNCVTNNDPVPPVPSPNVSPQQPDTAPMALIVAQTAPDNDEQRRRRWREDCLAKQRLTNNFHQFVEDNLIFKHGLIDKKKGLFSRRRMFLLTEGPRFFYVDPVNMELKGEIPLSADVRTEVKNFRTFFVYTPNRTYYLFDPGRHAKDWCDAIDIIIQRYFPKPQAHN